MTSQELSTSQNRSSVIQYAIALAPAIIIYVYRSWFIYSVDLCLLPILPVGMALAIVIGLTQLKNYYLRFFCFVTVVIAVFAPRPLPEKIHLALHRAEYESVVELARDHQLGHQGDCQYAYVLPDKYSNLSYAENNCIIVEYEPEFVVVFEPLFSRRLLVYAETLGAAKEYISCGGSDGVGYIQIEENWYRCLQDWN